MNGFIVVESSKNRIESQASNGVSYMILRRQIFTLLNTSMLLNENTKENAKMHICEYRTLMHWVKVELAVNSPSCLVVGKVRTWYYSSVVI